MKIYTKTGDLGETGLYGGRRLSKSDLRLEAYGTIDELNSYLGLIRALDIHAHQQNLIIDVQTELFTIGAHLAADEKKSGLLLPEFNENLVNDLEAAIDEMNDPMPEQKHFILPGGNVAISHAHVCRCICRRAERFCVNMQEHDLFIDPLVIKYINRLSDYIFVLARFIGHTLKVEEIKWKPRVS